MRLGEFEAEFGKAVPELLAARARLDLVRGDPGAALQGLAHVSAGAVGATSLLWADTAVLRALAHERLADMERAAERMEEALALVEPERPVRLFPESRRRRPAPAGAAAALGHRASRAGGGPIPPTPTRSVGRRLEAYAARWSGTTRSSWPDRPDAGASGRAKKFSDAASLFANLLS